jgi:hypothetical protein
MKGPATKKRLQTSILTSYFTPLPVTTASSSKIDTESASDDDDSVCLAHLAPKRVRPGSTRNLPQCAAPMPLEEPFETTIQFQDSSLLLSDFGVRMGDFGDGRRAAAVKRNRKTNRGNGSTKARSKTANRGSRIAAQNDDDALLAARNDQSVAVMYDATPALDEVKVRPFRIGTSKNIVHALILATYNSTTPSSVRHPQVVRPSSNASSAKAESHATTANKDTDHSGSVALPSTHERLSRFRVCWSVPSWLQLVQHAGASAFQSSVSKVAWDKAGELLAVAFEPSPASCGNPVVAVYNWDMVLAADLRGRCQQQRSLHREERPFPRSVELLVPDLTIPIPSQSGRSVSILEWNPFNVDELAVGLR